MHHSHCLSKQATFTFQVLVYPAVVVEGVEECGGRGEVCGGRDGGVWWEGEVCRSGEGMWDRSTGYREQVGGVRCVVS